jgi:hypothetical protein
MSNLSWKARFAHRADGKARVLVQSGSPAILNLRTNPEASEVDSIAAIEALVRRHLPLLKAKRAAAGIKPGAVCRSVSDQFGRAAELGATPE